VRAVLGKAQSITPLRGQVLDSVLGPPMVATVHPSSIVRIQERDDRRAALRGLVGDLRLAADVAASTRPSGSAASADRSARSRPA
jgi:DNA polymerase